ncbi:hypothetical protein JKF63_03802 [Porcisia hertigi]|uniref:Uncharacterized protein n=1 Tax=Porcisia hertigi TaxID=2761500 RepID=A0A836IC32_9TRYP|nr:hypothetical protein JKF63_03802 [Porcisia hertigi]
MPHLHSSSLSSVKATGSKPPLPSCVSAPAAGASAVHLHHPAVTTKLTKVDAAFDFSDNESILFAVDSASVAGVPTTDALVPRRQSSTGSIQFLSEPGSRSTSPVPKANLNLRFATPVEKPVAPICRSSSGKGAVATGNSINFEQSPVSVDLGVPAPAQSKTDKRTSPLKNGAHPPLARPTLTVGAASVGAEAGLANSTNDSIAFQIEDSGDVLPNSITTPSHPVRNVAAASHKNISSKRAAYSASFAENNTSDLMDNASIAFMVDDDADDKIQPPKVSHTSSAKRDTGTPKVTRPLSPSIQFDMENTENENVSGGSDTMLGDHLSPPLFRQSLPVFGHGLTQASSLAPDPLSRSPKAIVASAAEICCPEAGGDAGTAAANSSASRLTKKTIVTNHLQQRQPNHSRLPQAQKRAPTRPVPDAKPPLSQRTVVTPISHLATALASPPAHTAAAPLVSSAAGSIKRRPSSSRCARAAKEKSVRTNSPPSTTLQEQRQHRVHRSKESAATLTTAAPPSNPRFTEEESDRSMDSPPEPLFTGHRSHSSGEILSSGASPLCESKKPLPVKPPESGPHYATERCKDDQKRRNHRHGGAQQQQQQQQGQLNKQILHTITDGNDTSRPLREEPSLHPPHASALERRGDSAKDVFTQAEQWREFNEKQRAELADLRERISAARREDITLLESSPARSNGFLTSAPSSRSVVPRPTPMGIGYSSIKSQAQGTLRRAMVSGNDRNVSDRGGEPPTRAHGRAPPTGNARRIGKRDETPYASTAVFRKPCPYPLRQPEAIGAAANIGPRAASAVRMASPHRILHSAEAASVADLLGIFWPPRSPSAKRSQKHPKVTDTTAPTETGTPAVDLYFVNGSRLTPAQTEHFFELVRVQSDAVSRTGAVAHPRSSASGVAGTHSLTDSRHKTKSSAAAALVKRRGSVAYVDPTELDARRRLSTCSLSPPRERCTAPLSRKLAALLPKKAVRRSRVLREVFDIIDIKRQGSIVLNVLPSLARLLENELALVEKTRASLLQSDAVPIQSLLESAVASRKLHTSSWNGARESASTGAQWDIGSAGGSGGGALDYAQSTRNLQANVTQLTHRLLLLSFAVNVAIPIAATSRIPVLDFATFCIIVYAAVDDADRFTDPLQGEWRQVVQQYFVALAA